MCVPKIQESFQLAHETLYLAVTMTDLYMARKEVSRDEMQLVGATAILLASKFYVSSQVVRYRVSIADFRSAGRRTLTIWSSFATRRTRASSSSRRK